MTRNVGTVDRVLRVIIGCALIAFAFFAKDTPFSYLGWIGVIPVVTAFVSVCPLYSLMGIKTN